MCELEIDGKIAGVRERLAGREWHGREIPGDSVGRLTDSDPARKPIGTLRDSDPAWTGGASVPRTHLIALLMYCHFFLVDNSVFRCNFHYGPLFSCHLFPP
jgi:hypothetical protein